MPSTPVINGVIDSIIVREGPYVNHPNDKGGPTKYGITLKTLSDWRGHPVTADDVAGLSIQEAKEILTENYVHGPGFDAIPDPKLFDFMVDVGTMSYPTTAWKLLTRAVNRLGHFGFFEETVGVDKAKQFAVITAAGGAGWNNVLQVLIDERIRFLAEIVIHDPSQRAFLRGWLNRTLKFRGYA